MERISFLATNHLKRFFVGITFKSFQLILGVDKDLPFWNYDCKIGVIDE